MKINIIRISVFIFLIFFIIIMFVGLTKNNNYNTKNLVGNEISEFQLISLNNNETFFENNDLINSQFTLINFFASWCSPCRLEHKYLIKLKEENKKIKIVGINFKDKKNNALSFLKELGNPYEFIAKDSDGSVSVLFGVYGIPESILINNEQKIIKKFIGPINQSHYRELVQIIN
jgi:cytochrome c biogenesis protein CcmG/thiol:disulfide interchange protein DsbE